MFVGQIARDDFFAIIDGRGNGGNVRQAQDIGIRAHTFAQNFAQAPGSAGQQQTVERGVGSRGRRHGKPLHVVIRFVVGCRMTALKYR
ncbi:hypothetical protein D3C81_1774610 [compost metagenome]